MVEQSKKSPTLDGLIQSAYKIALKRFSIDGVVPGHWVLFSESSKSLLIVNDFGTDKAYMTASMKVFMEQHKVSVYVHVAEAWMLVVERPKDMSVRDFRKKMEIPKPSESPDRVEIVTFHGEDATGFLEAHCQIFRPKSGRPYLGVLDTKKKEGEARGLFVGLLPKGVANA